MMQFHQQAKRTNHAQSCEPGRPASAHFVNGHERHCFIESRVNDGSLTAAKTPYECVG